ncbi:efflux transporter periplasmic adaptor subunit [Acuticoccus sediminis]|uniref:Efflux transporter periplasmic adaptor subunit n=1 Tax=Acuticoccus sediminis TaxID=2184697 RepID=A0A8B2NQ15_9HYPH|nr:efflux RND transporter periplasmic adaptor subunit [Acuticoccus sediminis]RAI01976.1 efflux transporter periplasmic adaptor subunit [Acuticoccus sediminis]
MIHPLRRSGAVFACIAVLALAACNTEEEETAAPVVRPVRTITVTGLAEADGPTFSGRVEAADQVSVAFRIAGRLAERFVDVGTELQAGDPIARLEPQNERNAVRSAEAALVGAEAAFVRADNAATRHRELLARGVTAQAYFESVDQSRTAAQAQVEAARAQLAIAKDLLGFTELDADAKGVVTAVGAEPGEVVAAGQMIARLAREGGRDGVFDVPAQSVSALGPDVAVRVSLTGNPSVFAVGRVREVSPQADPVTRTFRVRVGLTDPPAGLRLGTGVTGSVILEAAAGFAIPVTALKGEGEAAAVWIVDTRAGTVSLRPVEVATRGAGTARIASGLEEGDVVVTAGVNVLTEGQHVRLPGAES